MRRHQLPVSIKVIATLPDGTKIKATESVEDPEAIRPGSQILNLRRRHAIDFAITRAGKRIWQKAEQHHESTGEQ